MKNSRCATRLFHAHVFFLTREITLFRASFILVLINILLVFLFFRKVSLSKGEGLEPSDKPMDDVKISPSLIAIDIPANQTSCSDHEDETDLTKIQRMEECIQRSLDLLENTQPIKNEEMVTEEVQIIENRNVEEEIVVIEEKRGSYFGLKDLESKILDIIKIGSAEVSLISISKNVIRLQ